MPENEPERRKKIWQENSQEMLQAVANDLKSRDFRAIAAKAKDMDLEEPDGDPA